MLLFEKKYVVLVHLQVTAGCMLYFPINYVDVQAGMQCALLSPTIGDLPVKLMARFYPRVAGCGPH